MSSSISHRELVVSDPDIPSRRAGFRGHPRYDRRGLGINQRGHRFGHDSRVVTHRGGRTHRRGGCLLGCAPQGRTLRLIERHPDLIVVSQGAFRKAP